MNRLGLCGADTPCPPPLISTLPLTLILPWILIFAFASRSRGFPILHLPWHSRMSGTLALTIPPRTETMIQAKWKCRTHARTYWRGTGDYNTVIHIMSSATPGEPPAGSSSESSSESAIESPSGELSDASSPLAAEPVSTLYDTRLPKLSRWRRMQIPIIAAAVIAIIRVLGPTLRFEKLGREPYDQPSPGDVPVISAFWHRCIISSTWFWRNRGIVVMNTTNFDGQWTRRVIEHFGFGTAQGSSTRGGLRGLAVMARRLEEGIRHSFYHRWPARSPLCCEAGAGHTRAQDGKAHLCFSHWGRKSADAGKSLGQNADSASLVARGGSERPIDHGLARCGRRRDATQAR